MVVADAPGSENAGEDTVSQNGIAGKEELVIGFIQADASGGVTGGVHDLEPVVTEFNHSVPFEIDISMKGFGKAVKVFAHHDELVLELDLVGGEPVGGQYGGIKEEGTGSDVVKVLMGQDDKMDIFWFELNFFEAVFEIREIGSDAGVNEDILHFTFDEIDMASGPVHTDLIDIWPEFYDPLFPLHLGFLFAGFFACSAFSSNRVS